MSGSPIHLRLPDGFEPGAHGWVRVERNSTDTMTVWERWEIPFKYPAVLVAPVFTDPESGAVSCFYTGPVEGLFLEAATQGAIHREILRTDLVPPSPVAY
ncbi:hypothetical protein ACFYP4_02470 [Streptomyces sp. NPDC005551]|uniref:hypothetical protein n=1 Tax=Streptomyces sp. NPDC005551 TaxID=3364725 RepID=UPI0036A4E9BB